MTQDYRSPHTMRVQPAMMRVLESVLSLPDAKLECAGVCKRQRRPHVRNGSRIAIEETSF